MLNSPRKEKLIIVYIKGDHYASPCSRCGLTFKFEYDFGFDFDFYFYLYFDFDSGCGFEFNFDFYFEFYFNFDFDLQLWQPAPGLWWGRPHLYNI